MIKIKLSFRNSDRKSKTYVHSLLGALSVTDIVVRTGISDTNLNP